MDTTIGQFDPDTKSVPVTFVHGGVTHQRSVNAAVKDDGSYDDKATAERVAQVANGVEYKIAIGVLTNPPPAPAAPPEAPAPAAATAKSAAAKKTAV